jgi:hypothetical protein
VSDWWSADPIATAAPTPEGFTGTRLTVRPPSAEKSPDWWSSDPVAEKPDMAATAKDVAKSGGIGVVKGIIGLAGAPGDLAELGARGIDRATRLVGKTLGIDVPVREDRPATYGSADIQKAVEGQTGEFYKPQTTPGEYAQTIGEFAPAAVAGPGGMARKLTMQAVLPGVASEAAGQYTKGTAAEPYARAGAAIATGLGGAALTRPSSPTGVIQSRLPAGVTQATVDDARKLMIEAKARGIDLTWPEALSKVAGKPVLTDTQRILESAPQSRTRMQEFFGERPQQFDQAALNEFGNIAPGTANPSSIGPQVGRAANETLGDVRGTINAASEPFYKGAEGVLLTPQEMNLVRTIPGWKEARAAVRNDPQLNSYVSHLPDNSVGFLNEVKKYFDQQAKNSGSKFNPGANQQVQAGYEKAASAVKQIGEIKSADYGVALSIQQQAREQYLQPLLDGPLGRLAKKDVTTQKAINVLFPSSPLPNSHNEIATAVSALAKKNPGAATQLVRAHLESAFNEATRSLQGGPNQFGAAGFAKAIVGNPQQRANLQAAIESLPNGKSLWAGFDGFLQAAEATGTRQAKGSLTAFNATELKGLSGGNAIGETVKTGLSPGKWWSVVNDKWSQWKLGQNLDELAAILTDPKSGPILKRIANMPSGGREAGYLVSRLILQGKQAAMKPGDTQGQ